MIKLFIVLLIVAGIYGASSNYPFDGKGVNTANPTWGTTDVTLLRKVATVYDDGISVPVGGIPSRLPSTRLISNLIFGRDAAGTRPSNPRLVTDMLTFWGQFLDHDIDFSPDSNCDPFKIPVPKGDFFYDVLGTGTAQMNFCRTVPQAGTGTSTTNKREFPNRVTAWLDGSAVYGNTKGRADALRTFQDGKLKTSDGPDGPLPPVNVNSTSGGMLIPMANPVGRVNTSSLFACGDARANENPILLSLHTLFIREHNRRASLLKGSDEDIYQQARRWVIGHMQAITFNEYLPTLIGKKPAAYKFDSSLDPGVSVFFSTVAFRYGHDEVSGIIQRFTNNGSPVKDGNILLRDAYFFPDAVKNIGIGPYLRGISVTQQNAVDAMIDEDMRTFLFNLAPPLATDLAARNMQRARDHGIGRYNDARKAYGLSECTTFSCVNPDPKIIDLLNQAYGKDNVTQLDPYLGGLLETKNPGSNLGPLFETSIVEQLVRIRNADRYWYQNDGVFTSSELNELETTKLSDILKRNTDTPVIPKDIFTRENISPAIALGAGGNDDVTKWVVGIIILTIICCILIIVIIGLCFANSKKSGGTHYEHLQNN